MKMETKVRCPKDGKVLLVIEEDADGKIRLQVKEPLQLRHEPAQPGRKQLIAVCPLCSTEVPFGNVSDDWAG